METLTEIFVKIVIEGIFVSGIIGLFIHKKEQLIEKKIEGEFKKRDVFFNAQFNFKLRALEELLAPIKLQLMRSKLTVLKYESNNEYREKILKDCNEKTLSLLLEKGFLIPADLIPYTEKFIAHYDNWLQEYKKTRIDKNDKNTDLVFTYDFPHDAETKFIEKFDEYRKELEIEKQFENM